MVQAGEFRDARGQGASPARYADHRGQIFIARPGRISTSTRRPSEALGALFLKHLFCQRVIPACPPSVGPQADVRDPPVAQMAVDYAQ
jgi:hypothetical protein